MALKGIKPTAVQKRLKALFYGMAGVGKTTAAIQFPKPYLIDTERGAENKQYVELLNKAGGSYLFTTNFDDILAEVMSLLSEKHEYQTLIIDPLTVIYNDMLDQAVTKIAKVEKKDEADKEVTAFGRHKGVPDRKIKHLILLLTRLDMNVIITSHGKAKWKKEGNTFVEDGNTYDCYPKLDYLFDLVFEIQKRGKDKRIGIVKKTRVEGFDDGETFDWSYAEIAKRYGREALERDALPEVLASEEQVATLNRLIQATQTPPEAVQKWLDKAKAERLAEMPQDAAEKCVAFLKNQLEGKATAAALA